MSLTNGHDLYASVQDSGFQKLIHSFYVARPHLFHFASPGLLVDHSKTDPMGAIVVPGANQNIDLSVSLSEPEIYFYNATPAGFPIAIAANQFGLHVTLTVCIGAQAAPVCAPIEVWAVGGPSIQTTNKAKLVRFTVSTDVVKGTGGLDPLLAIVVQRMLNGLFDHVALSVNALSPATLGFDLALGPEISDRAIKVWGTIQ